MVAAKSAQETLDGWESLTKAAEKGQADVVESLLRKPGMGVDETTGEAYDALFAACGAGHLEVVKLLVGAGARVEPQRSGFTLFEAAAMGGHLQVVKYLAEEAGADQRRANAEGWTALMTAADGGHADVVKYLLGRPGINIDAEIASGRRALNFACRGGHLEVVKLLVAAGARVEPQTSDECGVLGTVAYRGHLDVVKYLVEEAGADDSRADCGGLTPLVIAVKANKTDVVEYLRQRPLRREQEAEERAAAAAAALLEEEDRAAAAKGASSKKKMKKKGKKKGGATAPTPTPSQRGPSSSVEPSETHDDTQALAAVLASTTIGGEALDGAREEGSMGGGSLVAGADPEEPSGQHMGSTCVPRPPMTCKEASSEAVEDSVEAGLELALLEGLSCPISFQLMTDPVMADDGHTYERQVIQEWIDKCIAESRPLTSPLTGAEMGSGLKPNLLARSIIRNHLVRSSNQET